jgi:uncharacterized repeat protein (TIGR03803 family)
LYQYKDQLMKARIRSLFLLAVLGFTLAGRLTAQTFTTLYNFSGTSSDGCCPSSSLLLSGDTLYGTTTGGRGTLFKVNTDGTGFMNLHSFTAGSGPVPASTNSDGVTPVGALNLLGETLYGTARFGGTSDRGTLFKIETNGTGFAVLHAFSGGSDGCCPSARLVISDNILYGTAIAGGIPNSGTIFKVNANGTGFTNLYDFTAGSTNSSGTYTNSDGAFPFAPLILSGTTLYGTANSTGPSGHGTVFKVNTDGTGFRVLHGFSAGPGIWPNVINSDGANPWAQLILSGNTLYGTANAGGSSGLGTVFKVKTDGTGFTNLHSFTTLSKGPPFPAGTNSDGASPQGGLVLLGNTLYGTATYGGSSGGGTLFAVHTDGTGFTNLHNFTTRSNGTNSDGANPWSGLILSGNTLYGTAAVGGSSGSGTVFSLSLGIPLPTIVCSTPLILECTGGTAIGTVHAQVTDTNGNQLQVIWTMDGMPSQTNNIPSGGNITASNVSFTANFGWGEHVVVVSVSNGQTDPVTCSTTVTVHDTTPPQIKSIVATPNVIWPPNHRMVPVKLMVEAVDNCDPSPLVKITNVTCSEPQNPLNPDWEITGTQSVNLRAERLGKGQERVYTIVVLCRDVNGNGSTASVAVTVPHH